MLRIKGALEKMDMNLKLIISLIFLNVMFVSSGLSLENCQTAICQLISISGTELPSGQIQSVVTPVIAKGEIEPEPVVEESKILVYNGMFSWQPLYGGNVLPPDALNEDELEWLRYEDFHVSIKRRNPKNSVIVSTLTIRISFKYGGKYQGKGAYMADIRVKALKSESSGVTESLSVELPRTSIENCGSIDNPVSSIDLILNLSLRPDFYHNAFQSFKLKLRGNGTLLLPSGEVLSPSLTSGSVYY